MPDCIDDDGTVAATTAETQLSLTQVVLLAAGASWSAIVRTADSAALLDRLTTGELRLPTGCRPPVLVATIPVGGETLGDDDWLRLAPFLGRFVPADEL